VHDAAAYTGVVVVRHGRHNGRRPLGNERLVGEWIEGLPGSATHEEGHGVAEVQSRLSILGLRGGSRGLWGARQLVAQAAHERGLRFGVGGIVGGQGERGQMRRWLRMCLWTSRMLHHLRQTLSLCAEATRRAPHGRTRRGTMLIHRRSLLLRPWLITHTPPLLLLLSTFRRSIIPLPHVHFLSPTLIMRQRRRMLRTQQRARATLIQFRRYPRYRRQLRRKRGHGRARHVARIGIVLRQARAAQVLDRRLRDGQRRTG
jgi:hypothetical protein